MPEGQLEVGEAGEESVDIDVDPNAKTIRSDAEPEQPPEVIEEENQMLLNYCWESCLPCGAIPGCSNPNAINWSPWVNFDDGSCVTQSVDCPLGEAPIEIVVTPDNFGPETSWILFGDQGGITSAPIGTYSGAAPGIPISTAICLPIGADYDVVIADSYGDGLCASCATNNPNLESGNVQIFNCNGDTLYNLQDEFPDGEFWIRNFIYYIYSNSMW